MRSSSRTCYHRDSQRYGETYRHQDRQLIERKRIYLLTYAPDHQRKVKCKSSHPQNDLQLSNIQYFQRPIYKFLVDTNGPNSLKHLILHNTIGIEIIITVLNNLYFELVIVKK